MNDLKAAFRSLRSTPGATAIVLLTLAVAIGANTAIFSVVNGVLLRPLGYGGDESRLVVLWGAKDGDRAEPFRLSPGDYRDVRDSVEAFDGQVALYRSIGSTLTGIDPPVRVGSLSVTPRLFPTLGVRPEVGQFFTDEDEKPGGPKKLVITHASWTRRYGADPGLVGDTLELGGEAYTVVGVTQPGFQFPPGMPDVEMYFPMALSDRVLLDRDHRMFDAIARLGDGATLEGSAAELKAFAERLEQEFPGTNEGWSLFPRGLREELVGDLAPTVWVLFGAVLLVLLIACANIANILVARSMASDREFAVRAAMGAGRSDLLRRSLAESVLLGLGGGALGLTLALWGMTSLASVIPEELGRGGVQGLDGAVLLFATGVTLGATLLFGLVPALRSMRSDVRELLQPARAFGARAGGGVRLRELVVVAEVALAIVLLVGAVLMVRSFSRLTDVDPGFREEGVVSVAVQLPGSRYSRDEFRPFFEQLVERVKELPGVRTASATSDLPMSDVGLGFEMEFTVLGLDAASPTANPNAEMRLVLPGYFETMAMNVVKGRDFDSRDATREKTVVVVNQTLADRYFADVDPIGRSLEMAMMGSVDIIGVVSDVRHDGLQSKFESEIYLPFGGGIATAEMHIVVQSDLTTAAIANAVRDVIREKDPELAPSTVAAVSDLLWESVARPRFTTALLSLLALCAALLAAVGTYGIVAYSVSQRTGEIGVRMALGADSGATVRLIVRHALGIVAAGAVLGLLGSLGASRLLGQILFDVRATDPLTYAGVLAAALLVGVVAAWTPARRATRIDPVAALRDD